MAQCPVCSASLRRDHIQVHIRKHQESEELRAWSARLQIKGDTGTGSDDDDDADGEEGPE